jgi:hypothetical protein
MSWLNSCRTLILPRYIPEYDMKAPSEILALSYSITSMNSGKWYVSLGSNITGNMLEIQYKCT